MPFTVEEFRDIVRILEEKPEWRAELRRLVLTEELLSLPEQLAALRAETERRFQEMAATVDKLAREVARLGTGMGDLQKTQKRLIINVADLKGESLERRYRERAPAYFGGLIRRARAFHERRPGRAARVRRRSRSPQRGCGQQGGQAIPAKWRLTDANGVPI